MGTSGVGPELLGRLLDEHAGALVLYARQWCASAEDVVQEALIRLAQQKDAPVDAIAWLYRVVRNGAISAARAAKRRQRHEAIAAGLAPAWFVSTEGPGLDAATAAGALGELPIEQRETIVAHIWGGLTFEQIGEIAGVSSSTAHRWYLAGLSELRERLGVPCPNRNMNAK